MNNAQLISLSRQVALERQMDVVANNMANVNTAGFKAEQILFGAAQMPAAQAADMPWQDQTIAYTEDWATIHDFRNGTISQTGNPLDIALDGDGFLAVQTPAGERYTRNGVLHLDSQGFLVDANGNQILSTAGPIRFDASETDISIGKDGTVDSSAGNKGQLRIVTFPDNQQLLREGDNLFSGTGAQLATSVKVMQGAVERSNVSGVSEMSELIRVTRAYTTLSKMIEQQNQLSQAAIQQLGTLTTA
ncbi:MAG TPA: flagellar basal-body rod protein FlgF [Devosiaceae bacterium]